MIGTTPLLSSEHFTPCWVLFGSVDIQWGIIEPFLRRTALQADAYVFGFIRAHLHFVPMYTGYSW